MYAWVLWAGLLQAAPPCNRLDHCMQVAHAAASTLAPGQLYPACDALREQFEGYGEQAKHRLLAVANSANPAERDIAGCLLAGWPTWSQADLPALKRAAAREKGGGWVVRAMAKFPVEQAAAVVMPIVERDGGMNQAGFVLAGLMPKALPQVLHRMSEASEAERRNLLNALTFDASFLIDDVAVRRRLDALMAASKNGSLPAGDRAQALLMIANFGVRARRYGPAVRPLAEAGDPAVRKAAKIALRAMLDSSVLGEIVASCPPPGSAGSFHGDTGVPPPPLDAPGESEAPDCFNALAEMGHDAEAVAPQLVPYVNSTSWQWRVQAAKALGLLGNHSVSAALRPLLQDRDWQVVAATILAEVRLGDKTAIPALRHVAQTHWFAGVRRAANEAVAGIRAANPKALDALYQTDDPFSSLLWSNPLATKQSGCPLPSATKASMQVKLRAGTLSGSDMGEFGGKLEWMRAGHSPNLLLEKNVSGILKLSDHSAWVVTGLSHLSMEYAALYRVQTTHDGKLTISHLLNLPTASRDLSVAGAGLRSNGWAGSYQLTPADAEGHAVLIRQVDCAH